MISSLLLLYYINNMNPVQECIMIEEFNGDFLQWIRGFYYVARTGSITRAARKMNRSQSSVSYQIQCLERQLNVSLFDRINNRLKITPQGVRLLDWTIAAFELLDELEEGISASCDELNGKVGISGSMPIIGQDMFSRLLSRFMRENPRVHVTLRACRPLEAIDDIENGISDFGLVAVGQKPERFNVTPLCSTPFVLVAPKKHRFHLSPAPLPEELRELPFVMYMGNDRKEVYSPWLTAEHLKGLTGRTAMTVNQYQLVLQYIARGSVCAIMDELTLKTFPEYDRHVAAYPLSHLLENLQYFLLARRHRRLGAAATVLSREILSLFQGNEDRGNHTSMLSGNS